MHRSMSAPTAQLHEIFTSRQGEGPYTGTEMVFVRLQGCALRCRWCDTLESLPHRAPHWRLESAPGAQTFVVRDNPVTCTDLNTALQTHTAPWISITGGEPLEQSDFLVEWLPTQSSRKILLETSGVLARALRAVLPYIDVVSMDMKLPSSTGMRAYWEPHREFIGAAKESACELYIKMVIDAHTTPADIATATQLIADIDPRIPTWLQHASPTTAFADCPTSEQLRDALVSCQKYLQQVTVGQQMHKTWGVL